MTYRCCLCLQSKPLEAFYDDVRHWCRACRKEYNRKYREMRQEAREAEDEYNGMTKAEEDVIFTVRTFVPTKPVSFR